jgi:hypothetical protein
LQKVAGLERSVTYLEGAAQDTKKILETAAMDVRDLKAAAASQQSLTADVREMKASFTAYLPLVKWIAGGLWAIVCSIAAFGLVVLGMWLKHRNGW